VDNFPVHSAERKGGTAKAENILRDALTKATDNPMYLAASPNFCAAQVVTALRHCGIYTSQLAVSM
jgi:hypothetical protein